MGSRYGFCKDPQEHQTKVVALLIEQEELMHRLYEVYSHKYPEHESFLSAMADEELWHADIVKKLDAKVKDGSIRFNKDRFNISVLETTMRFLKNKMKEIESGQQSFRHALAIALEYEKSIIEKDFFKVFESDSQEMKDIMQRLSEGQYLHVRKLTEIWSKLPK